MFKAIICDLDGLLADSETLHFKAYREILSRFGYDLNIEEYAGHWIQTGKTIKEFVKVKGLDLEPAFLHNLKKEEFKKLVRKEIKPMPFTGQFLNKFHNDYDLAVATSSFRENAMAVLETLDILSYFKVVVTRDEVAKLKPDPEIFLYAASKLNCQPFECVVLEDAQKGIEAAHAAGMKSIAVPNQYTQGNDFSKATKIVSNLSEIDLSLVS